MRSSLLVTIGVLVLSACSDPAALDQLGQGPSGGGRGASPEQSEPASSTTTSPLHEADAGTPSASDAAALPTSDAAAPDGAATDAGDAARASDANPNESYYCDIQHGLAVYCVPPGGTHTTKGTIVYGAGFPDGLPALGLGAPMLGYIPTSAPFTCVAKGGQYAIGDHNVAAGKICEVIYENNVSGVVRGTASYVVTAAANAPDGDTLFGLNANTGARWEELNFYIRVRHRQ